LVWAVASMHAQQFGGDDRVADALLAEDQRGAGCHRRSGADRIDIEP
jgi:hypothetical protein